MINNLPSPLIKQCLILFPALKEIKFHCFSLRKTENKWTKNSFNKNRNLPKCNCVWPSYSFARSNQKCTIWWDSLNHFFSFFSSYVWVKPSLKNYRNYKFQLDYSLTDILMTANSKKYDDLFYLVFMLIWWWHSSSKSNWEFGWPKWVSLVITYQWVQWIKELFLDEVVPNCSIFHLSVFDWHVIHLKLELWIVS